MTGLCGTLRVGAKQRETALAGAVVAARSQAHCSFDGGGLVAATWGTGWVSMNVVVETVPNQDGRPLVVIVGAEGTAVRRRGVLEVVGLAALAVEPAVAVGQRRVGRTGLA